LQRIPVALVLVVAGFILGAALVAAGVALIYPPAGLITAGAELIAGVYAGAYITARRRR
jgi:hypothetical protein